MNIVFAVVTEVPSSDQIGNFYSCILGEYRGDHELEPAIWREMEESDDFQSRRLLTVELHTFHRGEILILDNDTGREIGYPGRKPSKWFVKCEYFNALENAIAKSQEVI